MPRRGLNAFPYYGGKNTHLPTLLPQLAVEHRIYCEPFCGAANVVLNKPLAYKNVAGDVNGNIINFFKVLRDHPDELLRRLQLTPYHSGELDAAVENSSGESSDIIERARVFFVRVCQSRAGNLTVPHFSRSGAKGKNVNTRMWNLRCEEHLPLIAKRLKQYEWNTCSYEVMLDCYDAVDTLFYIDPPYLEQVRTTDNGYEFDNASVEFHKELLQRVVALKGMVAISGYDSEIYNEVLRDWHKITWQTYTAAGSGRPRTEILWRNYRLQYEEQSLF